MLTDSVGTRAGDEHDIMVGFNRYLNPLAILRASYVWTRINSVDAGKSSDI